MKANRKTTLDLIFTSEGGYTNDSKDPGGPTGVGGITLATLRAWRKNPNLSADAVQSLTSDEAYEILGSQYLPAIRFDDLPLGLDYAVADCAVNSGPAQAAKLLQRLVGVTDDGIIGEHTLAAVGSKMGAKLVEDYCAARLAFMKTLNTWPTFGNGWTARTRQVNANAYRMLTGNLVPAHIEYADLGVQAKASATDTRVTSTPGGQAAVLATLGALGTAAATAAAQLQPFAGVHIVQSVIIVLTVVGALAGMSVAVARARSGSAA